MTSAEEIDEVESAPAPSAQRARRRKLYPSTWVFLIFVGVVLFLANVPGQIVVASLDDPSEPLRYYPTTIDRNGWLEHGWPMTYLWRQPRQIESPGPGWKATSLWSLMDDVYAFRCTPLLADVAIACLLMVIVGLGFQAWRRRRKTLFRFSLLEMLLLVGVACSAGAWIRAGRLESAQEREATSQFTGVNLIFETQPYGPSWMRQLLGDEPLGQFDRITICENASIANLEHFARMPRLRVLRFRHVDEVANEKLAWLSNISSLEMLLMTGANRRSATTKYVEIPRLDNLKFLNVEYCRFRGDGIENCPNLIFLDASTTEFDDEALSRLANARDLECLSLEHTRVTGDGMKYLAALKNLRELQLGHLPIDDTDLAHLANLKRLRWLNLSRTRITDASIPMLCQLPSLRVISLPPTVSVAGRMKLTAAHGRAAIMHEKAPDEEPPPDVP